MSTLVYIVTLLSLLTAAAPKASMKFDREIHDWGDITVSDGPQTCRFTVTNGTASPQTIVSVVPSCGCTAASWTRTQIAPGEKGTIDLTYSNDEGAHQFDKTVTVYTSDRQRPTILHLRGVVHSKKMPLSETHPVHFGSLALRSRRIKVGNMVQGGMKSGEFSVANIGTEVLHITFRDMPPQVSLTPSEVQLAPQTSANVAFTVKSDRSLWGRNEYPVVPAVNGVKQDSAIVLWAVTKEDFSAMTPEMKKDAARMDIAQSAFSFGPVHSGAKVEASFHISNSGKSTLKIYRIDIDSPAVTGGDDFRELGSGESADLHFTVDTKGLKKSADDLFVISVYTNSPTRAVAYLYLSGIIL